ELPGYVKSLNVIPACFSNSFLGGVEISGAWRLDYPALLAAMRRFFAERNMLREEKFQFSQLKLSNGIISYKDAKASKIIFCEGSNAVENPYFKGLPFSLAKGETLMVKMDGFPQDKIWHKGIFILPLRGNLFRIGATYEWNFSDGHPSEKGKR